MKEKILGSLKPYLSAIDRGVFFRTPLRWLYLLIAFVSLIVPFYFIFYAFRLNSAYWDRDNCRANVEIAAQKFRVVTQKYESLAKVAEPFRVDAANKRYYYDQANDRANQYKEYVDSGYGEYYQQAYEQARQEAAMYYQLWQKAEKKYISSTPGLEQLKAEYEKQSLAYEQSEQEFQEATVKYDSIASKAAFHKPEIRFKAIFALILFSILSLAVGLINFLIFWDRKSTLDNSFKENDEFTTIPVLAHSVQTLGESIGTYIAVMGFSTVLIAVAFNVCFGTFGLDTLFLTGIQPISENLTAGIPSLLIPIAIGFFVVVIFRVFAEAIKALVVIANNTKMK